MKKILLYTVISIFLFTIFISLSGCGGGVLLPDLVAVNPTSITGWCNVDDSGNLSIYIKNQGDAPAGSFTVKIEWGYIDVGEIEGPTPQTIPVNGLGVEDTEILTIPGCTGGYFGHDWSYTIYVDSGNDVEESNEDNNIQNGSCVR